MKDVRFVRASVDSDLGCGWDEKQTDTIFNGPAYFDSLRCGGDGNFFRAQFQSTQESDFSFSKFGGSLFFTQSSFSGRVKLEAAEVSRDLVLAAQHFQEISLYNATTEVLVLSYEVEGNLYTYPRTHAGLDLRGFTFNRLLKRLRGVKEEDLQFAASLDLRGFTFNRVRRSKEEALQFAKAQNPTVFSFDPYAQLEEYYEKVGKDTEARDVHYEGRCAMRRTADTSSDIRWTFGRKTSDSFLRALTGYGVRTSRVAWAIVIFLVVGTIVFSLGDFTPLDEALAIKSSETSVASGAPQKPSVSEPTVVDQLSYSVDRLIPINMGIEDSLEPRPSWSRAYALLHAVAGWLLIPLFLASWSGLVRSRR